MTSLHTRASSLLRRMQFASPAFQDLAKVKQLAAESRRLWTNALDIVMDAQAESGEYKELYQVMIDGRADLARAEASVRRLIK